MMSQIHHESARQHINPNVYGPAQDWAEGAFDGAAPPADIAGRNAPPVVSRSF